MAMDVVKETVAYARSREAESGKHFRFTITTNGVLLDDDTIDYINREMDNCVLSLDGRKEVNDRFRVSPNGKGSYDVIVPKFKKLVPREGIKTFISAARLPGKISTSQRMSSPLQTKASARSPSNPCRRKISTTTPCGRKICPPSAQNMKSWRRS